MRSLVIGASGQVGGLLHETLARRGDACLGTSFRNGRDGLRQLDVRDAADVNSLIRCHRPEVVYLPAALTHVDYCETHRDECFAINVEGPANLARALQQQRACVVYFSTEHVFGDSAAGSHEDEPTAPRSVYAQSKAAAEDVLRALLPERHLILRTSWVFGPEVQRKNFVYRAVSTLRRGEMLIVPKDQHGQPTYSPALVQTALDLVERRASGTFHVVGPQYLNRQEFAWQIATVFGLNSNNIQGRATAELTGIAPRPLRPRLCRAKLLQTLGRDPIPLPAAALEDFKKCSPHLCPA